MLLSDVSDVSDVGLTDSFSIFSCFFDENFYWASLAPVSDASERSV